MRVGRGFSPALATALTWGLSRLVLHLPLVCLAPEITACVPRLETRQSQQEGLEVREKVVRDLNRTGLSGCVADLCGGGILCALRRFSSVRNEKFPRASFFFAGCGAVFGL